MTDTAWNTLEPRLMELGPDTSAPGPWKAWRLTRDEDGIDWLIADQPGASANTVSEEVLEELDQILAQLEKDPPKALVIRAASSPAPM